MFSFVIMHPIIDKINELIHQKITRDGKVIYSDDLHLEIVKAIIAKLGIESPVFSARYPYLIYRLAYRFLQARSSDGSDFQRFSYYDKCTSSYLTLIASYILTTNTNSDGLQLSEVLPDITIKSIAHTQVVAVCRFCYLDLVRYVAEESTQLFYFTHRPYRLDLFKHLSAEELFFVDIDALCVEAMSQVHIDWVNIQSIVVVQVVRRILNDYLIRKGNFHVIEFKCNQRLWISSPQKLLLREVIRVHIKALCKEHRIKYKAFPSWWSDTPETVFDVSTSILGTVQSSPCAWVQYLRRYSPEFVVLSDGEQIASPEEVLLTPHDPVKSQSNTFTLPSNTESAQFFESIEDRRSASLMLRALVLHTIAMHFHVVYISRQVAKDNSIYTFVVRTNTFLFIELRNLLPCLSYWSTSVATRPVSTSIGALTLPDVTKFEDLAPVAVLIQSDPNTKFVSEFVTDSLSSALDLGILINTREIVLVLALKSIWNSIQSTNRLTPYIRHTTDTSVAKALINAYIVCMIIQRDTSLSYRAQPPVELDLGDSSTQLYIMFSRTLSDSSLFWFLAIQFDPEIVLDSSIIDLIDLRFFLLICFYLKHHLSEPLSIMFSKEHFKLYKKITKFVFSNKEEDTSFVQHLPAIQKLTNVPTLNSDFSMKSWGKLGDHPMLSSAPIEDSSQGYINCDQLLRGKCTGTKHWNLECELIDFDKPPKLREFKETKVLTEEQKKKNQKKSAFIENRMVKAIQNSAKSMGTLEFLTKSSTMSIVTSQGAEKEETKRRMRVLKQLQAVDSSIKMVKDSETTASAKTKGKKKATYTEADRIINQNILVKSYEDLANQEKMLNNALKANNLDTLSNFLNRCSLPWCRLITISVEGEAQIVKINSIWKLFFTFASNSRQSEYAFVTSKDSKGMYTAMGEAEKFVTEVETHAEIVKCPEYYSIYKDITEEMDETQRITFIRAIYMFYYEHHLKFQALSTMVSIICKQWKEAKEDIINKGRIVNPSQVAKLLKERQEKGTNARNRNIQTDYTAEDYELPIKLFQKVHEAYSLIEYTRITVQTEQRNHLRFGLCALDFPKSYLNLVDELDKSWESGIHLNPLPIESASQSKAVLFDSAPRFQMLRMGHLLERPFSIEDDPRVPFRPDKWQKELLDIVDRRGSVVVCAPTSAGKTFISYYCMTHILKTSNTDIVVYVAPTRALINQAMADVYMRFAEKQYGPNDSGIKIYGSLGGESYAEDPFNCQILITLPEPFEALLLSPYYQQWATRIKYVIFDEIHSIDVQNHGAVWERLLMIVRAPFIALSATIGQVGELAAWLNRIKRVQAQQAGAAPGPAAAALPREVAALPGFEQEYHVHTIPRGERIQRWSDLEVRAYLPTRPQGLRPAQPEALLPIHPLSCTTVEMLQAKLPEDLPFRPAESVELHALMRHRLRPLRRRFGAHPLVAALAAENARLDPDAYFAQHRTITQAQARAYEAEVKAELLRWGRYSTQRDYAPYSLGDLPKEERAHLQKMLLALITETTQHFKTALREREEAITGGEGDTPSVPPGQTAQPPLDNLDYVCSAILGALSTLKHQRNFPVIVFSFEEEDCEKIARHVVEQLEEAEAKYRQTDAFKEYERNIKTKAEIHRKQLKTQEGYRGKKLEVGDDGKMRDVSNEGRVTGVEQELIEVPDVLEQFTFASAFNVYSAKEMKTIESYMEDNKLMLRALKRGIGIHHTGVRGKLRMAFERLFRLKYLPIIFATETLALGVHSPCKTVIIAGDHPKLNPMQYRQMAGRAGRRGLDFYGLTVFIGVPFKKIQRLMTSNLNVLKGHVQLDCVSTLRLQQLYDFENSDRYKHGNFSHQTNLFTCMLKGKKLSIQQYAQEAHDTVECLTQEPLFFLGRKSSNYYQKFQIAHARHTLLFAQHFGLIHPKTPGLPVHKVTSMGALVTRILNTYHELFIGNTAFTFVTLLQYGTFDQLAGNWDLTFKDMTANKEGLWKLLTVLAYLFSINRENELPEELHRSVLSDPDITRVGLSVDSVIVKCPHQVFLPPLSAVSSRFSSDLQRYSRDVVLFYSHFIAHEGKMLDQHQNSTAHLDPNGAALKPPAKSKRLSLPLFSKSENSLFPAENGQGAIYQFLEKFKIEVHARCPFVAIAGLSDVFTTYEDMTKNLRTGLMMDPVHLPGVDLCDTGRHAPSQILINAGIVDFATTHIQTIDGYARREYLDVYNGLNAKDSYYLISQFCTLILNLVNALHIISPSINEVSNASFYKYVKAQIQKDKIFNEPKVTCCNPSCELPIIKYGEKEECIIPVQQWYCLDCIEKGQLTFLCDNCHCQNNVFCHTPNYAANQAQDTNSLLNMKKENINYNHRFERFMGNSFCSALNQLASQCKQWYFEVKDNRERKSYLKPSMENQRVISTPQVML